MHCFVSWFHHRGNYYNTSTSVPEVQTGDRQGSSDGFYTVLLDMRSGLILLLIILVNHGFYSTSCGCHPPLWFWTTINRNKRCLRSHVYMKWGFYEKVKREVSHLRYVRGQRGTKRRQSWGFFSFELFFFLSRFSVGYIVSQESQLEPIFSQYFMDVF